MERSQVVVEVKNRMRATRAPELHDKLQLVTYMLLTGCAQGDLVQCVRDAPDARVRVDRVLLAHHRADYDRVVVPRLLAYRPDTHHTHHSVSNHVSRHTPTRPTIARANARNIPEIVGGERVL